MVSVEHLADLLHLIIGLVVAHDLFGGTYRLHKLPVVLNRVVSMLGVSNRALPSLHLLEVPRSNSSGQIRLVRRHEWIVVIVEIRKVREG